MSESAATPGPARTPPVTWSQTLWRRFCRLLVSVFYRRCEVTGLPHLPARGPVLLCANHANALADAVIIQSVCQRPIHPLARSGLFRSPLLRPVLALIQAIPIYRRNPAQADQNRNEDSFRRVYSYLGGGRVVLIFPEGQSHSDPSLRPIKTGGARIALGSRERNGRLPTVIPVGLTFSHKGRFRSQVLVQLGAPVTFEPVPGESTEEGVRRYTAAIMEGLVRVTLNADSWQDVKLLQQLHVFFRLRSGRRQSLAERFRTLQRLIETHRWLRLTRPDEVALLRVKLERFEQLCRRYGVKDYHLNLQYRPLVIVRFVLRALLFLTLVLPLALWGTLNSALPYFATRLASKLSARGRDQYDTAGMLFGILFFALFWGGQSTAVYYFWGARGVALYMLSVLIGSGVALKVGIERRRIVEHVRVFLLFLRRRGLKDYLRLKRQELEVALARMARLARQGLDAS